MKRKQSKVITFVIMGILLIFGLLFGEGLYGHFHKYTFPGPLSAAQAAEPIATETHQKGGFSSHAEFEQECGHCHAPLHCVTDTKCQDCHMEIAEQRGTTTGLHSRLPGVNECQTCHTEHQGRDASITEFAFHNIETPQTQSTQASPGEDYLHEHATAKFDLLLSVAKEGPQLTGTFEYATGLFKEETIKPE